MTYDVQVIVPAYNLEQVSCFLSNYEMIDYSFIFVLPSTEKIFKLSSQHTFINQSGTGIYNAINEGIKYSKSKFYLVCGCDDYIDLNILNTIDTNLLSDINVFSVLISNLLHLPLRYLITDAHKALISEHSVGTIVKKNVHVKYGFYDENLKIASDAKFILLCSKYDVDFKYFRDPLGCYSGSGCSTQNYFRGQIELIFVFAKCYWYYSPIFTFIVSLRILRTLLFLLLNKILPLININKYIVKI
jgi:glycosyltransferase involved in cell wall biosynthesis